MWGAASESLSHCVASGWWLFTCFSDWGHWRKVWLSSNRRQWRVWERKFKIWPLFSVVGGNFWWQHFIFNFLSYSQLHPIRWRLDLSSIALIWKACEESSPWSKTMQKVFIGNTTHITYIEELFQDLARDHTEDRIWSSCLGLNHKLFNNRIKSQNNICAKLCILNYWPICNQS